MKKQNLRGLIATYDANCARLRELADKAEQEQRAFTPEEKAECDRLSAENARIQVRANAYNTTPDEVKTISTEVRDAVNAGGKHSLKLAHEVSLRDRTMVADPTAGGLVKDLIQPTVLPLMEQTVYDLVGIPMQQGLAGNFVWPVVEFGSATINGEGETLSTQKLKFNKLTASPERIGYAYEATRESIEQSEGVVETLINQAIPMGVNDLLNRILMSTTKQVGANLMQGPFVALADNAQTLATSAEDIKWADLNKMKAGILKNGIRGNNLAWVMTKSTAAILEGTPINAKGIYRPMIENGVLCGVPVFTTEAIGDNYIGLGDWSYQPAGFFGEPTMLVDPYTTALDNSVRFVYNTHFATKTIREEAFALAKIGE